MSCHCEALQLLLSLAESRSGGVVLDMPVLEVVEPFLKRRGGYLVEFVDTYDEVFGEHLRRGFHTYGIVFLGVYHERVVGVNAAEYRLTVIEIVGAFAEVVPGVDGLIHISQIADHRIEKPGDELSEGQMVDAKITAVDEEKQKISLSIRALLAPTPAPADAD